MGEACELFAAHLSPRTKVGQKLLDWPGDVSAGGASLPLRLMGCLHRLVLSGESPELAAIYPPQTLPENAWSIFERALIDHEDAILKQLAHAPQTNEVRRSGILVPGFMTIAHQTGNLPCVMSELGASAGLNVHWEKFHYKLGDSQWGDPDSPIQLAPTWNGPSCAVHNMQVDTRAGCDLNPIDLSNPKTAETLLSYLWADQPERVARTRAAIDIFKDSDTRIEKMGAINWLEQRLATPYENRVHIVYHTIARQYFSDGDKANSRSLIETAGARATPSRPLAWLRFEADGQQPGAALTLRLWNGGDADGEVQFLGRADYHGRWVDWAG